MSLTGSRTQVITTTVCQQRLTAGEHRLEKSASRLYTLCKTYLIQFFKRLGPFFTFKIFTYLFHISKAEASLLKMKYLIKIQVAF